MKTAEAEELAQRYMREWNETERDAEQLVSALQQIKEIADDAVDYATTCGRIAAICDETVRSHNRYVLPIAPDGDEAF